MRHLQWNISNIFHYYHTEKRIIHCLCTVRFKEFINQFFLIKLLYFCNSFIFSLMYQPLACYLENNTCACAILCILNLSCIAFNTCIFFCSYSIIILFVFLLSFLGLLLFFDSFPLSALVVEYLLFNCKHIWTRIHYFPSFSFH